MSNTHEAFDYSCLRCGEPPNDVRAFCAKCGYFETIFDVSSSRPWGTCPKHSKAIVGYCCLCEQPVCDDCVEQSQFSFAAGFVDTFKCKSCISEMEALKASYLAKKKCISHGDRVASDFCSLCSKPICKGCCEEEIILHNRSSGEPYTSKVCRCDGCRESAIKADQKKLDEVMERKREKNEKKGVLR